MSVRDEVFAPAAPGLVTAQGGPLHGVRILGALRSPELFGHERGNIEAFKALRTAGADVRVAVPTLQGGGAVRRELERLGFTVYPMTFGAQWSKSFIINDPLYLPGNMVSWVRCQFAFDRAIRDFRPTHVQLGNALTFNFVELAIRRHRLPLVLRLGDAPPVNSKFQIWLWKRLIARSIRVVVNSQFVLDSSARAFPQFHQHQPRVIHNSAPTPTDPPNTSNYTPGSRTVVYVGQIIREKGVFQIIDAASRLKREFPDLNYHFVGGSAYTKQVEEDLRREISRLRLESIVHMHGWVSNARGYLAHANVHVAPSLCSEAFSNVVMEAKCEGTPSVVFPSGGLPEEVTQKKTGFICQDCSGPALAEGLAWALRHAARTPGWRQTIRAEYLNTFGPERYLRQWAQVFTT